MDEPARVAGQLFKASATSFHATGGGKGIKVGDAETYVAAASSIGSNAASSFTVMGGVCARTLPRTLPSFEGATARTTLHG